MAPQDGNLWYKDAVIYQLHVRTFCDSDGNGSGDFRGLTNKLDYLKELGVNAVWLLPFYPSPLRDDGYDIADYTSVNPSYGTIDDFKTFLNEAHSRGIRVITEVVVNHTSDQHPWFQEARSSRDNPKRDWYVWSDTDTRYQGVRIIFVDTEMSNWSWDPISKSYYWHRFFSHQPDLNYDNPAVREAVWEVMKFWLDMGVDGFRLDAVPYLVERDGTSCENLPETHDVIKDLRKRLDEHYPGKMLLAEANQWPADVRAYFGDGDEFHMAFHFPLMPRMFMAVKLEDRKPIIEILEQTPQIPDNCQWCIFLAESRRVDAGDGDRHRARLHVRLVRERQGDADQPGDPAAAGADDGERPAAHRIAERVAAVDAGNADHLLWRRDRDGRQHLSRRSQRRADADAVEWRVERGIFFVRSGTTVFAADFESGVRVSGGERGFAAAVGAFAAVVDEVGDSDEEFVRRCSAGDRSSF